MMAHCAGRRGETWLMSKEQGSCMTQGRGLPKWLLLTAAAAAIVVSPIDLAWQGGTVDLTASKALAKDGGGNGGGNGNGGGGNGNGRRERQGQRQWGR